MENSVENYVEKGLYKHQNMLYNRGILKERIKDEKGRAKGNLKRDV